MTGWFGRLRQAGRFPLSAACRGPLAAARPSGRPALTGACATLPIGRAVGPADVAARAVHLMTKTALTGATNDIDGGQQFTT